MSRLAQHEFRVPDVDRVREMVPKYDRPGPRYTSYPTVPVWTEAFGEQQFRQALRESRNRELSLYVHIPYCEKMCSYCACNRVVTQDHSVATPYLDGLEREAEMLAAAIGGARNAVQLALGGGSPNFFSADELARICRIIDARFPALPDAERSIEVDPRTTTREQLEVLAEYGFNRVSLGVQDFSPKVQEAVHRIQSIEETEKLTRGARDLGYRSVNYDLIYGLPFQTVESFESTVEQVLKLRPERIALYSYAHVTWVQKAQRGFEKKDLPSAELKAQIMLKAIEMFQQAGYKFLGLDHFALPDDDLSREAAAGTLRRNFMGYTTRAGVDLLGFGATGISELAQAYAQSVRDPEEWLQQLASGRVPTLRGWQMSEDDIRRKWLIQRLMCQSEISDSAYRETFGESLAERIPGLEKQLDPLVTDGLLAADGVEYRVTPVGRIFLRVIAMVFDAYLPDTDPERPSFSRTV